MAAPGAPPLTQWQVVCAVEKHGRAQGGRYARLTLGDALLALPTFQARRACSLRLCPRGCTNVWALA